MRSIYTGSRGSRGEELDRRPWYLKGADHFAIASAFLQRGERPTRGPPQGARIRNAQPDAAAFPGELVRSLTGQAGAKIVRPRRSRARRRPALYHRCASGGACVAASAIDAQAVPAVEMNWSRP